MITTNISESSASELSPVARRRAAARCLSSCLLTACVWMLLACAPVATKPEAAAVNGADGPEPLVTNAGDIRESNAAGESFDAASEPLFQLLVAEFAGQRGRLEVAVQNYLKAARDLRTLEVAQRASRIAVFARDTEAAIEATRIWAELDPNDAEARQILAAMYIRKGDADNAREHLEAVLNSDPAGDNRQLRMIVNLLGREQDKNTALAVMEQLLATRADDRDALLAYALLAIRAEKLDQAKSAVDRIAASGDVESSLAVAYTAALQKQDRTTEALHWLGQLLKRQPDDEGIRMIYARLLADSNRYAEARAQFSILAERSPDNSDVIYALGLLSLQAEQVDDAKANFEKLIALDARTDEAKFYLGQIAEATENYDQALAYYRDVNGGHNHFQAQVRVALILANTGDTAASRAQLNAIDPGDESERRHLVRAEGEILTQEGMYEEAMAIYDEALGDDYDMELLYTRAMLAERMGRLDILERDLRRIIEREPDNSQALNALGYTLADRTDRYEEALGLIERALVLNPEDFYILDSMGWVMYRLGRFAEAVEYLERARSLKNDPEVAAHLAKSCGSWVITKKHDACSTARSRTPPTTNAYSRSSNGSNSRRCSCRCRRPLVTG